MKNDIMTNWSPDMLARLDEFDIKIKERRARFKNQGVYSEEFDGTLYWYLDGQLHREDGPAVVYSGGSKFWYLYGKLHREDGPACVYHDGHIEYWVNGTQLKSYEYKNNSN